MLRRTLALLTLLALAACASPDSAGVNDAGAGDARGEVPRAPDIDRRGFVNVTYAPNDANLSRIGAGFTVVTPVPSRGTQTQREAGPCRVNVFRVDPEPLDAGVPPPINVSAGTVTVTGGRAPGRYTLVPDAGALYPTASEVGPRWAGGDHVSAEASGGEIPAFQLTVAYPSLPEILDPQVVTAGDRVRLNRSAAYAIHRTPGTVGSARVEIFQLSRPAQNAPPTRSVSVICTYSITAAELIVPAAALTDLEAATPTSGPETSIQALTMNEATTTAGSWPIRLAGVHVGLWARVDVD